MTDLTQVLQQPMQPPAAGRFEVRWSNGAWKVFDTQAYTSVAAYGLRAWADEARWNLTLKPTT